MLVARSWPRGWTEEHDLRLEAEHHYRAPRVIDNLPRLEMSGFNYLPLLEQLETDLLLLEWDIAASPQDLNTFALGVQAWPHQVRVAPYYLYPSSTGRERPEWAHLIMRRGEEMKRLGHLGEWRPVRDHELRCDIFSFGMIYLPLPVVRAFLDDPHPTIVTDTVFAHWHWTRQPSDAAPAVEIDWRVRPVHLNFRYELPTRGATLPGRSDHPSERG